MMINQNKTAVSGKWVEELDSRLLGELATRVRFRKGAILGLQNEICDSLFIIARGQVLLRRRSPEGQEHALYLLGPGDLFGEGAFRPDHRWMVTAQAMTDGVCYSLPATQLARFTQHFPQLTAHVVMLLSERLERTHRRMDVMSTRDARERLLGLLQSLAARHGDLRTDEIWLPLRLTQAELGEMVGLARETVVRALADLEAEGRLRRQGRQGFWLRPEPIFSPDLEADIPEVKETLPSS